MKIISDTPVQLDNQHLCIGIVKENGEKYAVIIDMNYISPVKIYVNKISMPNGVVENIKVYEVEDDEEFKHLIETLKSQTLFFDEKYIQKIIPGSKMMVYKYKDILIDKNLLPIKRIEDYIFLHVWFLPLKCRFLAIRMRNSRFLSGTCLK